MKEKDLDFSVWAAKSYPSTLKALAKHPDFRCNQKMADAYICGYWRGLQDAVFELQGKR
jgi:hypothetical protein